MEINQGTLDEFRGFAERQLDNHKAELGTRYREREVDQSTLKEAYDQHARILENELEDKVNELSDSDNVRRDLSSLKTRFVNALKEEGGKYSS